MLFSFIIKLIKRFVVVFFVILVFISIMFGSLFLINKISSFSENDLKNNNNISFSSNECAENIIKIFLTGLFNKKKWIDKNILRITSYKTINCSDKIIFGGYKKIGNIIILGYDVVENQCEQSLCVCNRELVYEINNLPRLPYFFFLVENKTLKLNELKQKCGDYH